MSTPRPSPQQEAPFYQSLKVIPIHNPTAKIVRTDTSNEIEVEVKLAYTGTFMRMFQKAFKLHQTNRYILDGIGKRLFTSVDGKKTFEQIIDEFAAKEKLTFFESRALIGEYFQTLTRRGIIIATLPK